jgi:hypothetical protein
MMKLHLVSAFSKRFRHKTRLTHLRWIVEVSVVMRPGTAPEIDTAIEIGPEREIASEREIESNTEIEPETESRHFIRLMLLVLQLMEQRHIYCSNNCPPSTNNNQSH